MGDLVMGVGCWEGGPERVVRRACLFKAHARQAGLSESVLDLGHNEKSLKFPSGFSFSGDDGTRTRDLRRD
ncbi:MAG: hypothetical protein JXQ80_03845, partial [Bacteroidales bacterium]|nr:hypothetical protein [Bacteroidales bacterium]